MSFRNFTTGHSHAFGGEFLELVPHERVRYTDRDGKSRRVAVRSSIKS